MGERDFAGIAIDYARGVARGDVIAGRLARLACERFLRDLDRAAHGAPFVWRPGRAASVCLFVEELPHIEGECAGREDPRIGLEPWQVWLLSNVFGFRLREAPAWRRFNTAYVEVARKNAKTTLTAGVGLYCLTMEDEPGAQVPCAATTGSQARLVFDMARKMVERTPDLRSGKGLTAYANAIACAQNSGTMKPINSRASSQDGLNPHCAIIDELHAHKTRALFDVLKSARGARKNPLSWYITTAGSDLTGVCYEQRDAVQKILEGTFEADHYFGVVYALDEEDDCFNESAWPKANPNLGVSVDLREFRSLALDAKRSADSLGEFKTKKCNLWLNAARPWLSMAEWDQCAERGLSLDAVPAGSDVWIGADLANANDIAALGIVVERGDELLAFSKFYLPEEIIEAAAARSTPHYLTWAKSGILTATRGAMIDFDRIAEDIVALAGRFTVRGLGFDRYQAHGIATRLFNDGLPVVEVHMSTATVSGPAKELEARVQSRRLRHDGNPCLKWCASNTVVYRDEKGNIFPKRNRTQPRNKIDGVIALILALERRRATEGLGARASVFEDESERPAGLVTL